MDHNFNGMPGQQVQPVQYNFETGQFCMADQDGRLVALDLGQGDVHFDAPLAAFAPGYALDQEDLIADKAMPAHKVGRLWKFQASEVDSWVRSGGTGGK